MARQVGADEQSTVLGMSKAMLKAALAKLRNNRNERAEVGESRRAILDKAIDKDHAHKGALILAERLDRMEAVKRNEYLYHFDVYRGHLGWDTSDLLRAETEQSRNARDRGEMLDDGEAEPLPA